MCARQTLTSRNRADGGVFAADACINGWHRWRGDAGLADQRTFGVPRG